MSSLERRGPWLLTAAFVVVAGLALAFHEPWRDEIQAWLLARDSAGPLDLVRSLRHEGHPGLWHLVLMPIARISPSPIGMQLAALAVGAATVWIVAALSPFTWPQRLLFGFGYFPLYEYTALSRSYGLGLLLLLVACALFRVRYRRPIALASLLFLACHTSAHAMLVAAGIGVALAVDLVCGGARQLLRDRPQRPALRGRRAAIAAVVVALVTVGALSAYWQLAPPGDGPLPELSIAWDAEKARNLLRLFVRPFLPVTTAGPGYWRTSLVARTLGTSPAKVAAGAALLAATALLLAGRRNALVAYVASLAGLLHLFYDKHPGGIRHHGFLFVAFLVGCWLAEDERRAEGTVRSGVLERARSPVLTGLLAVHALAGLIAVSGEVRYEFSAARRAARALRAEGLADVPMVAEPDWLATGLLGFLEKDRAFFPRGKRWGSFVVWDEERLAGPSDADVVAQVTALRRGGEPTVVLVLGHRLPEDLAQAAELRPLGRFTGDVIREERFFLYAAGGARQAPRPTDPEPR